MYLDYFGLKQKPFLITPDPAFLYPSAGHQQALAHLQYGLRREGGFLLLTGEVGTGKTTLCRLFMDNLSADFRLAYLLNTKLESSGLLAGICRELGIALDDDRDLNTLVEKIYDNLLAAHANQQHTLVVIEEAQNLSPDVLETLRLLTNLETSATKLLHILLIGQPELLETLRLPGLRQLNQRVVSRSHLGALSGDELPPYFRHRLKMAGTDRPLFSAAALRQIHRKTGGIPRLVNLLAEHCLMGAYALGKSQVDSRIVREAARELFATLRQPVRRRNWPWAMGLGVLALVVVYLMLAPAPAVESWRQWLAPTVTESPSDNTAAESPSVPVAAEPLAPDDQPPIEPAESPAPVPEPTPAPSAFQQLLAYWGIDAEAKSEKELCTVAEAQGLFCIRQPIETVEVLQEINRPMLVRLFNDQDGLDIYCLREVADGEAVLANSEQQLRKPLAELIAAVDGTALLLWRPPAGYLEPLKPGATNPELVAGLIRWLMAGGYLDEPPVTGGLYSQYLVDKVKTFQVDQGLDVDGILGIQTLVELTRHKPDAELLSGEGN